MKLSFVGRLLLLVGMGAIEFLEEELSELSVRNVIRVISFINAVCGLSKVW